jgi:hypothetical protein
MTSAVDNGGPSGAGDDDGRYEVRVVEPRPENLPGARRGRVDGGRIARNPAAMVMAAVFVVLGVVILVRTAQTGGGAGLHVGYLYGGLLMTVGALRLWLAVRAWRSVARDAGDEG